MKDRCLLLLNLKPFRLHPALWLVASLLWISGFASAVSADSKAYNKSYNKANNEQDSFCTEEVRVCIRADQQGNFDLKNGFVEFVGNVKGLLREQSLRFSANRVLAQRSAEGAWRKMILSGKVRFDHPLASILSTQADLTETTVMFHGNVSILTRTSKQPAKVTSHLVQLNLKEEMAVLMGQPQQPIVVTIYEPPASTAPTKDTQEAPKQSSKAEAKPQPESVSAHGAIEHLLKAKEGKVFLKERRLVLSGKISWEIPQSALFLNAERFFLSLPTDTTQTSPTQKNNLKAVSFRAEGGVNARWQDVSMQADSLYSQTQKENTQIVLAGNARITKGSQGAISAKRLLLTPNASNQPVIEVLPDDVLRFMLGLPEAESVQKNRTNSMP